MKNRIKKISFDNFRVYNTEEDNPFSLEFQDKQVILLYGNNGFGKSSFFDGIEWAMTGQIQRYKPSSLEKKDYFILKNHFNQRNEGFVEIEFDNNFRIKRKLDVKSKNDYNSGKLEEIEEKDIKKYLVKEPYLNAVNIENQFNVSHLLSQELVDSFIKEKKEADRYENFLSLYGLNEDNKNKEKFKNLITEINVEIKKNDEIVAQINEQISSEKAKINGFSDTQKFCLLENKIKETSGEEKINLNSLNEKYVAEKILLSIELQKLEKNKDILLKSDFFYSVKRDIELLKKNKFEYENLLKHIEKQSYIKIIDEVKSDYIKYLDETKNYDSNLSKFNQLISLIEKMESFNEDKSKIQIYYQEEKKHNKKMNDFIKNKINIAKFEKEILEKESIISTLGKLAENFLLASKHLLKEGTAYNECPLCGNNEFNQNDILIKLEEKLKNETNPILIIYQNEIFDYKLKISGLKTDNEEIMVYLKEEFETELREEKNKKKKLDEYFSKISMLKINYDKVVERLKILNISFDSFELSKIENLELLKNNSEDKIGITSKLQEINNSLNSLQDEDLKCFNNLMTTEVNLVDIEKKLMKFGKEFVQSESMLNDILSLKEFYKENIVRTDINELEKKLLKKKKEKEILEKSLGDFREFNEYLDKTIFNEVENMSSRYEEKIQALFNLLNPHRDFDKLKIRVDKKSGNLGNTLRIEIYNSLESNKKNNPTFIFSSAQTNVLAIAIFLTFALDTDWSNLDSIFLDDPIQNMDDINIHAFTDLIRRVSEEKQVFLSTHDERVKDFMLMKFGEENVQLVEFEGYGKVRRKDTDFLTNCEISKTDEFITRKE